MPPPPPWRTSIIPSDAYLAAGTVTGLASDSASARCCVAADNASIAAAASPARQTTLRAAPDIIFIAENLPEWRRWHARPGAFMCGRSRHEARDNDVNAP